MLPNERTSDAASALGLAISDMSGAACLKVERSVLAAEVAAEAAAEAAVRAEAAAKSGGSITAAEDSTKAAVTADASAADAQQAAHQALQAALAAIVEEVSMGETSTLLPFNVEGIKHELSGWLQ